MSQNDLLVGEPTKSSDMVLESELLEKLDRLLREGAPTTEIVRVESALSAILSLRPNAA